MMCPTRYQSVWHKNWLLQWLRVIAFYWFFRNSTVKTCVMLHWNLGLSQYLIKKACVLITTYTTKIFMRNIYDFGATINLSASPTNTKLLLLHVQVLRRYTDSIIGNTWARFEKKVQPNDWSIKINVASERKPMFLRLLRR